MSCSPELQRGWRSEKVLIMTNTVLVLFFSRGNNKYTEQQALSFRLET